MRIIEFPSGQLIDGTQIQGFGPVYFHLDSPYMTSPEHYNVCTKTTIIVSGQILDVYLTDQKLVLKDLVTVDYRRCETEAGERILAELVHKWKESLGLKPTILNRTYDTNY